MRTIPPELLDRVKKKWQVPAENADPRMKIYLSRGFLNELFEVFTIQNGDNLSDVDVTVKRPDTKTLPSVAYAIAIKNGVAEVKSKPLPYDDQIPWIDEFGVATGVTSVAIEFDGYWDRDYHTRRFNFVTDDYPWIFYVKGGNLYSQYWQDEPTIIATDVTKVAAIRGWVPVAGDTTNDQGLIVSYLKSDGTMWYKGYCIQNDGSKAWDIEREITELTSEGEITDLALFRTNDFRIGFMAEIDGEIWWTLSDRNYAGMSYWPELLTGKFGGFTTIDLIEVEHSDLFATDEHLTGSYGTLCIGLNQESDVVGTCTGAEITGDSEFTLEFSQPLVGNISRIKDLITVSNEAMTVYYTPISTEVGETQNELVITVAELLDTENAVKVTVGDASIYLAPSGVGSMLSVAPFYVTASLVKDPYHLVNLTGRFGMTTVALTEIFRIDTANQEAASLTGKFGGFTQIVLTKVGTGDV
jgi:hypothetical protein